MKRDGAWRLDATAQAALVRSREVSAGELVEAAIARVEALNPALNAVVTPLFERAREQARVFEASAAPFAGVPLLVKDAGLEIAGTPYYAGLRVLRDAGQVSARTTELARRFERAGFIVIGKTLCPAFSSGITTEPAGFAPARNPWDPGRTTSGSSGGSAAAVAVGMTAVAHGGDATGSLRYPAAACGVVTLKPTRGLMPHETVLGAPDPLGLWTEFVLARSVRDLAGVLDAVCGAKADDLFSVPAPQQRFADAIEAAPRRLRVGLMRDDPLLPVHAACREAVEIVGRLLADAGHNVDEAHPAALDGLWSRTAAPIALVSAAHRAAQLRWLGERLGRAVTEEDVGMALPGNDGAAPSAAEAAAASETLEREMLAVNRWWDEGGYDLLVTPTLRQPAWALGGTGDVRESGAWPAPYSFSGQPAMSLPLHTSAEGLPVGVQVVAARNGDALLLCVAAQLEAAAPWAERWPVLAGG